MEFIRKQDVRKLMLIFELSSLCLTGCVGTLYAGSSYQKTAESTYYNANDKIDISWYDGEKMQNTCVYILNILDGKDADRVFQSVKTEYFPDKKDDTVHLLMFQMSEYENCPMRILDINGDTLSVGGVTYDGNVYHLSDGWHAAWMPNGVNAYVLSAGNAMIGLSQFDNSLVPDGVSYDKNKQVPVTEEESSKEETESYKTGDFFKSDESQEIIYTEGAIETEAMETSVEESETDYIPETTKDNPFGYETVGSTEA